jgi:hypothetical protein
MQNLNEKTHSTVEDLKVAIVKFMGKIIRNIEVSIPITNLDTGDKSITNKIVFFKLKP